MIAAKSDIQLRSKIKMLEYRIKWRKDMGTHDSDDVRYMRRLVIDLKQELFRREHNNVKYPNLTRWRTI